MIRSNLRSFQKISLLSLIAILVTVQAAKKKGNYPFEKGSGVILNEPLSTFDDKIKNSDHLSFIYVFSTGAERSEQMTTQVINPLTEELKDYVTWYAFDCAEAEVKDSKRFQMCDKDEYTPFFQLMKPAEIKINPYTKQPMQPQTVSFNDNQVDKTKVKNFILNNIPDFTQTLDTKKKAEDFKGTNEDQDINRVILFSKKAKVPPIFKVLSAEYRDRIRFGFVSSEKQEVGSLFEGVNDSPTILVLKTYDPVDKVVLDSVETFKYDKKEYKIHELKEFLEPFARLQRKEAPQQEQAKTEETTSEKAASRKKPYAEIYTDRQFNTNIADNEKAALVFFILGTNVTAEFPLFDKIVKQTLGPMQIGVFYVNESSPDFIGFKLKYKLTNKFPQLRFYKNNIVGEDKNIKSSEIIAKKKVEDILDEIHEQLEYEVKEVNEQILNNLIVSAATEERKNVLLYFYKKGPVSIHFKALSVLPILKDSFVFMSVTDPSQTIIDGFQVKAMPAIGGVLAATNEEPEQVRQFTYGGGIDFEEILQNMLQLTGKKDEYEQQQKNRKKESQRKFEEITNQYKFQQNCLDRQKGCAIAFLPAMTIVDYEKKNHEEYIETLEQLEKDAKTLPIYYMWVNATCHNYLLEQFDVNPMFVPTVVFYLPQKDKSAHLIGKFDKQTIQKHEQKFINGKLPTFEMTVKHTDFEIKDIDCINLQPEVDIEDTADKELEDEILREILEEEKQRVKEEELRYKKKGKTTKKKKEKAAAKEDL